MNQSNLANEKQVGFSLVVDSSRDKTWFKIIVKLRSFLNKCVPRFKIMYALFVLITKHSNQTVRVRFGSYESYDQNLTQ